MQAEADQAEQMEASLNEKQRIAFDTIMAAVDDDSMPIRCFFLDGPGGSGKTYLYNTIISKLRGRGKKVLAVASTGIAANLLPGGRTYHSQFKTPLGLDETSVSFMTPASKDATAIKEPDVIIWDEATMTRKEAARCT